MLRVGDESPDDIDGLPLELVLEVVIVKDLDICTGNKKKTFYHASSAKLCLLEHLYMLNHLNNAMSWL